MLDLSLSGKVKGIYAGAVFLGCLTASATVSAQTVPVVGGGLASSSELLNVGLVVGGDMLNGSLLDDTLSLPSAGLVLGGSLIDVVLPVLSLDLLGSLPSTGSVLELVDVPTSPL